MSSNRKLAAIMFTDIVGYTALMGKDETAAYQLLKKNRKVQRPLIEKHGGKWLKELGDGVLASFQTISDAVYCAIEIQRKCEEEPDLELRIGIHQGEVIVEDGDVFGDGVNIASRLEPLAPVGGIYVSESVFRNIQNKKGVSAVYVGEETLKNVDHPVRIYEINVEASEIIIPDTPVIEPPPEVKTRSKGWIKPVYILPFIVIVVVVAYLVFNNLGRRNDTAKISEQKITDKSIAVLPFDNESSDEENQYFVNGMMEDIRNNLSKIADLRVISKTSTEKYRGSTMLSKDIARELEVAYLLEGTVQKIGNRVKIHAQLIHAETDNHLWAETYTREMEDVFNLQSEIAQIIGNAMYSTITPKEKEMIESIPTTNLTAYDLYLKAQEEQTRIWLARKAESPEKAIILYWKAIEIDSTFAKAYAGLAMAYRDRDWVETYFEENFLDSVLLLANKAIQFDPNLEDAYFARSNYYATNGDFASALQDLDRAIEINPNFAWAYWARGRILYQITYDILEGIQDLYKAIRLDHSPFRAQTFTNLWDAYAQVGLIEEARKYIEMLLSITGDTMQYNLSQAALESITGNYEVEWNLLLNLYRNGDRTNNVIRRMMQLARYTRKLGEVLYYAKEYEKEFGFGAHLLGMSHRIGWAYWVNGMEAEGRKYFEQEINHQLETIRLHRGQNQLKFAHYDLAASYAFLGEREKAYKYLDEVIKRDFFPLWFLNLFKEDPLLDSLRQEVRFQEILKEVEEKHMKERRRVQAWLDERGARTNLAL